MATFAAYIISYGNMKKIYLSLALLLMVLITKAQAVYGVFAGAQASTAHYDVFTVNLVKVKQETGFKFGFQAGAMLKVQFDNGWYFSPLVHYSMKGYKVTFSRPSLPPDSSAVDNDVTLHSFEIAPLIQYNFSADPGHFFVRGGPSLNGHISGKEKFNTTGGTVVDRKMKFSFGDYGRFGASLQLHLGYETSTGLVVYAHYTHGVGSLVNTDGGPNVVFRTMGISFGKYLSRK
ncbi:MAG TPA: porin family protein [Chitinophagaceae bacterium]|nr:porin family protein [Chitinophagaceae bacterium]